MPTITTRNNKRFFNYPVLWVSLASLASLAVALLILAPIFLLYHMNYISIWVTVWTTLGVFVAAIVYDDILLCLIKRSNRDACHHDDASSRDDLRSGHF